MCIENIHPPWRVVYPVVLRALWLAAMMAIVALAKEEIRCSNGGWHDVVLNAHRAAAAAAAAEGPMARSHLVASNVALTSHGSLDRLDRLEQLCEAWRGPMHLALVVSPSYACSRSNNNNNNNNNNNKASRKCRVASTHMAADLQTFWSNASSEYSLMPVSLQEAAIRDAFASPTTCLHRMATLHLVRPSPDEMASAAEFAVNSSRRDGDELLALQGLNAVHGAHNPYLHYPANVARNAAIEGARLAGHELHLTLDADIELLPLPNGDCSTISALAWRTLAELSEPVDDDHNNAARPRLWPQLAWTRKIMVLPTIQVSSATPVPRSVAELMDAASSGNVTAFYSQRYYPYNLTSADEGFVGPRHFAFGRRGEATSAHIEPFHIAATFHALPYDERFLGRHGNKIAWFQRAVLSVGAKYELVQMSDFDGPVLMNRGNGDAPDKRRVASDTHVHNVVGNQVLLDQLALDVVPDARRRIMMRERSVPRELWAIVAALASQLFNASSPLGLTRHCVDSAASVSSSTFCVPEHHVIMDDATEYARLREYACSPTVDDDGGTDRGGVESASPSLCDVMERHTLVPTEPRYRINWLRSALLRDRRGLGSQTAAVAPFTASMPAGRLVRCDSRPIVCIPTTDNRKEEGTDVGGVHEEELKNYLAALCGDASPRRRRRQTAWGCDILVEQALRGHDGGVTASVATRVNATVLLTLNGMLEAAHEIDAARRCYAGGLGAAVVCIAPPDSPEDVARLCHLMPPTI